MYFISSSFSSQVRAVTGLIVKFDLKLRNNKICIFKHFWTLQVHRISQLINDSPEPKKPTIHNVAMTSESPIEKRQSAALHTPVPAPSVDDMEPQNISFIGKNL